MEKATKIPTKNVPIPKTEKLKKQRIAEDQSIDRKSIVWHAAEQATLKWVPKGTESL